MGKITGEIVSYSNQSRKRKLYPDRIVLPWKWVSMRLGAAFVSKFRLKLLIWIFTSEWLRLLLRLVGFRSYEAGFVWRSLLNRSVECHNRCRGLGIHLRPCSLTKVICSFHLPHLPSICPPCVRDIYQDLLHLKCPRNFDLNFPFYLKDLSLLTCSSYANLRVLI